MCFSNADVFIHNQKYKPLWVDTKTLYITGTNEKSKQITTNYYNSKTCMFRAFRGEVPFS